jgi:XTP/dITP diphosphohydrolase
MRKIVFATNNIHKLKEIRELLKGDFEIVSLKDIGFEGDIPETGNTLKENASQKSHYIYDRYGLNCFADDTGLEVEALNGSPGVYSARYAGENCSYDDNVNKLLKELGNEKNRKAAFKTVISLIFDDKEYFFEGKVDGVITKEKHGEGGFGYDPVFQPNGYNKTFAEMELEQKNKISHRGKATLKLVEFLKTISEC